MKDDLERILKKKHAEIIAEIIASYFIQMNMFCEMIAKTDDKTKRKFLEYVKVKIGWKDETKNEDRE